MTITVRTCGCRWDPEYHRELNVRRGKEDRGADCTNPVYADVYYEQGGVCLACAFGCAE